MAAPACERTVGEVLGASVARLTAAGVAEPRADAEVLLAHALDTTRAGVIAAARRPLPAVAAARFAHLVERRVTREPVHHLVGEREFWSLSFAVDRRVLVPRPETELVVETALRVAPGARRVLDVGTGSGVLAAVLARELPAARVCASEREADALAVARTNLARHAPGVGLVHGDLLAPFAAGAFDLIVANPPYCAEGELAGLAPEVGRFEPRAALAAGPDGLDVLRALVAAAPAALAPGGWLVVEMGTGQAAAVRACVAADGGYAESLCERDAAGIERVLAARRRDGEGRRRAWRRS
jgi:release factor glutamine methyltransferase